MVWAVAVNAIAGLSRLVLPIEVRASTCLTFCSRPNFIRYLQMFSKALVTFM